MYNYNYLGSNTLYGVGRKNTNLYGERPLSYNRVHAKTSTQKIKENSKKKAVRTALAIFATGVLAYKGAPVINKVAVSAGKAMRKAGSKIAVHCPNLAKAGEYFLKACKAPLKPIDKLVGILSKTKKK